MFYYQQSFYVLHSLFSIFCIFRILPRYKKDVNDFEILAIRRKTLLCQFYVESGGDKVVNVGYIEGQSTTGIIEKIV